MKEKLRCGETHYGDSPYRSDVHGILLHGRRGRLLSVLYTAGGEGLHPVVLLLHGIPGCEKNIDLAQDLRRAGFHVLMFHYSGSWGSDGDYALAHNLEDAETALDFILSDEKYGFDGIVGNSPARCTITVIREKKNAAAMMQAIPFAFVFVRSISHHPHLNLPGASIAPV